MEVQLTAKGQTYQGIARAVKVLVFVTVAVTAFVLARIVFLFFDQLKTLPGYRFVIDFSDSLLGPFKGIKPVNTPFKGIFDIGAVILLMFLIVGEFILSGIAGFFSRRARHEVIKERPLQMPQVQVVVSPNIGNTGMPVAAPETAATPEALGETPDAAPKPESEPVAADLKE